MKVWHYEIFKDEVWTEHNVKIIIDQFLRATKPQTQDDPLDERVKQI